MVARSTDAPRTSGERIDDANQRLADLHRRVSRGSPALRSTAGVMRLTGVPTRPTLNPDAVDSTAVFTDGGVEIRDTGGGGWRDLAARGISGTNIETTGSIGSGLNVVAEQDLIAQRSVVVNNGGINVATGGISANGSIGSSNNLAAANNVFDRLGNVRTPGSEPAVKTDVEPIEPAEALSALAGLPYSTYRYIGDWTAADPATGELRRFAGPMLPDLADHPLLRTAVRRSSDDTPDGYDQQTLVGILAAAMPAVRAELDRLCSRISELEARLA